MQTITLHNSNYGQIFWLKDAKRPYKVKKYSESPFEGLLNVSRTRSFKTQLAARAYLYNY
jgi:hypothetical protein